MKSHHSLRFRTARPVESLECRILLSTVAYWRFEEGSLGPVPTTANSIVDSSPNRLNGTPSSGSVLHGGFVPANPIPQTGAANVHSLEIGTGGCIAVPDNPALYLTHSLTLEAYIAPEETHTGDFQQIVFRGDSRNGLDPYFLMLDNNYNLVFHIQDANSGNAAELSVPFTTFNQYTHVAGTLDDATGVMSLYVNGVLQKSMTTVVRPSGALQSDQHPGIGIGALQNFGDVTSGYRGEFYYGFIDEVRISDVALDPSQFLSARPAPRLVSSEVGDGTAQRSIVKGYGLTFSELVTLAAGAVTFERLTTDASGAVTSRTDLSGAVSWSASGGDGRTWAMSILSGGAADDGGGALPDDIYQVTLHDAQITGAGNTPLTGGTGGSQQLPAFGVLRGDLNGDGSVGFSDLLVLAQNYGSSSADWAQGDLNSDGVVNFDDLLVLAQRYGRTLSPLPLAVGSRVG